MKPINLKVIVPRFGANMGGGFEQLVWSFVTRLAQEPRWGIDVEVWTTCAKDHRTWENYYPAGQDDVDGVSVRRFPVDKRDLDLFIKREIAIAEGQAVTLDGQFEWLHNGVNSAELYSFINAHRSSIDVLLAGPYLFPTTFWATQLLPEKSVLLPCFHDEPYARLSSMRAMMRSVRGFIFNADPEAELCKRLCARTDLDTAGAVVGLGFDEPDTAAEERWWISPEPERMGVQGLQGKYLVYFGRKETGKNLHLLLTYFEVLRARVSDLDIKLLLMGSGKVDFRQSLPDGVIDCGFVSEEAKGALIREAICLCQPSVNESFSIVLMEAWLRGTPVIVHGHCAVTYDNVIKSRGGLFFENALDFVGVVRELSKNLPLRKQLGEAGRAYVRRKYSWDEVMPRFAQAIRRAAGMAPETTAITQGDAHAS